MMMAYSPRYATVSTKNGITMWFRTSAACANPVRSAPGVS